MTVVAIEAVKFKYTDLADETLMLQITADSRVSRNGVVSGDISPKIMPISLVCADKNNNKRAFNLYGFCFSGSVIAALNTHVMAQYLLTNLFSNDTNAPAPSVCEVAKIYADVATIQMKEIGGRLIPEDSKYSLFEGVVMGFSAGKASAVHIKPNVSTSLDVVLSELNFDAGPFRMGSGSAEFDAIISEAKAKNSPKTAQLVIEEMIRTRANPTVGGSIQLAKVDHEGFNQLAVLEIIEGEEFANVTVLGVELSEVSRPRGYKFGQQARAAGDLARRMMEHGEEVHTRA